MTILTVQATHLEGKIFKVQWRTKTNIYNTGRGGIFKVFVPHEDEARALAELRAIHYLLEDREIVGQGSMGKNIVIEQSFGSIKKALTKSTLKKAGVGKTEKAIIAMNTEFLATKYFSASLMVRQKDINTGEFDYKSFEESDEVLPWCDLRANLYLTPLGENVAITRHAMIRKIGRIDLNPQGMLSLNDLPDDLEDSAFPETWNWFKRNFKADFFKEVGLSRNAYKHKNYHRLIKKARFFVYKAHPLQPVLVIRKDSNQKNYLSTILRFSEADFLDRIPVQSGQWLRKGNIYE